VGEQHDPAPDRASREVAGVIGLRAAVWVLTLVVRLLGHQIGRRLLAALALTAVCASLVALVFAYPEPVEPEPVSAQPAPRPPTEARPAPRSPATGSVRSAGSPEQVAAAWYAQRKRLPRSRVRVLQRDRVSATVVRVLVLADGGDGRLDTAVVIVRRHGGGWQVRP
jgi:hypothetical protein